MRSDMDGRLHSHGFNELAEGLVHKGKVIVDAEHKALFATTEVYDDNHIVVDFDEFKAKGGEIRFVSITKTK